ncbi:DUF1156 domain-containing protein [Nocardia amamiensis]|uniref:DUF1156 domain-containing protein n=1 Tax=Nocardia amamiensis TaxID=404578 RepID=UPI000830BDBF|nr:DUF1156 domain-containing protein [Nocardia amamiensis]
MTDHSGQYQRKLIDVTLPLTAISKASISYKERKVGTIKNLHKWFAPMPTPALRALIFASLVDDPGPGPDRDKLVDLVEALVPTDGTAPTAEALRQARRLIGESNPELPIVLDPFAGGGSTVVEALRLGLPAVGSDLNPVAALITRVLGELLPAVASAPALFDPEGQSRTSDAAFDGFTADVRRYGAIIESKVRKSVGHHYPTTEVGRPVAWLWARTVPCHNPRCTIHVPLFGSAWLSKQGGREATVEAVVAGDHVEFVVHKGKDGPCVSTKSGGRAQFTCPKCATKINERDLRDAGKAGKLGLQLMAYCVDMPPSGRTFVGPKEIPKQVIDVELPDDLDDIEIGGNTKNFAPPLYDLRYQTDLYTPRQLTTLAAFADEVAAIYDHVLDDGGTTEQARAIASVLGICVSKMAQGNSSLVRWRTRLGPSKPEPAFGTQAMPMLWDFAEAYPFGDSVGSWSAQIDSVIGLLRGLPAEADAAHVAQVDARSAGGLVEPGTAFIVTDPPYFGQINYADLSDYFYLWLRRALRAVHPDLFATIATPKAPELVANPARHDGDKAAAQQYFIDGFTDVFTTLQKASRSDLPIVVAYAAKQDDAEGKGAVSSAWVSLLQAVLASGLAVVGTMPIESTMSTRQVSQGANALASYIILICRPREADHIADKSTFLARLREDLPDAIEALRKGGVSPLDMGQAAIGPGMRIFSQYRDVLQADGAPMTVRDALVEIDKAATVVIDGEETEFDPPTRFALKWFRQFEFGPGTYGDADVVLRQTGTSIRDLEADGIVSNTPRSTVRLLGFEELPARYNPLTDHRISHWEVAMHMAMRFNTEGIDSAAQLVAGVRARADSVISLDRVNRLVHRLFKVSDRRYQNAASMFNQLGAAWPDIVTAARQIEVRPFGGETGDLLSLIHGEEDE